MCAQLIASFNHGFCRACIELKRRQRRRRVGICAGGQSQFSKNHCACTGLQTLLQFCFSTHLKWESVPQKAARIMLRDILQQTISIRPQYRFL